MKTEEEGSLTIFSALSLLLILSFLLALLEGARVSGLQMMDTLAGRYRNGLCGSGISDGIMG